MINSTQTHNLPEEILTWVIQSVDPYATVLEIHALLGGTSSNMYDIALQTTQGTQHFVLRLVRNKEWLEEEPDLALHEANSLSCAFQHELPSPQIIAYDEKGKICGAPAVLMTKLNGSVVLQPKNEKMWVDGLAKSLVQIHKIEANDFPWHYYTYTNMKEIETPTWSSIPEKWSHVIDYVRHSRPSTKTCFIHRDYHPANVLWENGTVSGIVDWINACRGPAGIDVGHCRVDLAQLHGVKTANIFLEAYQNHAGHDFVYDPYWDILSVLDILFGPPMVFSGWKALGVTNLTDAQMAERLDEYILSLIKRI
ncbi:phosphotransferase family protein [Shimazuella kribbensis]|uniref:phosphotransferase family protein n=1 Tax=Shimazuella kribbensis TaxID=139808 RepID=UPI00042839EF|nr:aminoglycoside phosphotransferase family protein [Shimazuella kribbensis]